MSQNNKRLLAFDAIKLFAIFLVVYGHCILHLQNYSYDIKENIIYRFVSSFHMPLFMAISGYFGSKIFNLKFSDIVAKKWKRLIVPSISFGVLFGISWCYFVEEGQLRRDSCQVLLVFKEPILFLFALLGM